MEGEINWPYLSRPTGTNESMWCMKQASPRRQPITGFGLNEITNHGPWPAPSFPTSDKPQHVMSIFFPTASCPVCVFIYCSLSVSLSLPLCVCGFCLWLYSDSNASILDNHLWENSGEAVDLFSYFTTQTKDRSRLLNSCLHSAW